MNIKSKRTNLQGHIQVPGSKSHTIRALLLACLAEGESHIHNPLPSADCLSTAKAIPLLGANVELGLKKEDCDGSAWIVQGAGKNLHLPVNVVDVGDSGSLLYFLSPICATFEGVSIFTGDESIRRRPVHHVVDALNQLGARAETAIPGSTTCPLVIKGPVDSSKKVVTGGTVSSQYISGLMMSAILMDGTLEIELTEPKETPYLVMTQDWLEKVGVHVEMSEDFKHIKVQGHKAEPLKAFNTVIPSDWEGVAFPLVAALITDSEITIDNVDLGGTQGDSEIVEVLKKLGADIEVCEENSSLVVRGMSKSRKGGRLSTENVEGGVLHVNLSGYPDALCAMSVAACFTEGTVIFEDIAMCRRKETDRIKVMTELLTQLGAEIEEGEDFMIVHGHSPLNADGTKNEKFVLHGGTVPSYDDHRVAMSLSCMGMGLLEGESITVTEAECCAVSFPNFYKVMNAIGSNFEEI